MTPEFELYYGKSNITENIKPYLLDLSYTDHLAEQSDELQVSFADSSLKWIDTWFPTQGDVLQLKLGYAGQALVDLGKFEIVEIEFNYDYSGASVSLKALSTGISKANRTNQPKAYVNTTLKAIVEDVARKLKLNLTGTIQHIPLQRVSQYQERDVEFLTRLAAEYNHSFKIVDKTLVFTTMQSLQQREPVVELDLSQVIAIRLSDTVKDMAKVVEVKGFHVKKKQTLHAKQTTKDKRQNTSNNKKQNATSPQASPSKDKNSNSKSKTAKTPPLSNTLKVVGRADSQQQIDAKAAATTAKQEDEQQSGTIQLIGNAKLVAGNTILLKSFGKFNGKYLIKSARHSFSYGQGFMTDIDIRMLEYIA
ncbi:MAG: contractile injection system protein, VgrG/Pvc8 family [Acinetobacter sp.]|nr:contractile injection system protein, VgrG/Pvc8 family [Acinetobacter sp.]